MARKRRLTRLVKDVRDQVNVEALMKRSHLDVGAPMFPDTRLSALVGGAVLAATSAPTVTVVASDHVRVSNPNRKQQTEKMKHHRVGRG